MSNYRFASWPEHNGKKVLLDGEPGQVIYRHGTNATNLRLKLWTQMITTDANGGATVTFPAGYFTTVNTVTANVVRNSTAVGDAAFVMVRSFSTTQTVLQCFEGRLIVTILLGGTEALETTGVVAVNLAVFGLGA